MLTTKAEMFIENNPHVRTGCYDYPNGSIYLVRKGDDIYKIRDDGTGNQFFCSPEPELVASCLNDIADMVESNDESYKSDVFSLLQEEEIEGVRRILHMRTSDSAKREKLLEDAIRVEIEFVKRIVNEYSIERYNGQEIDCYYTDPLFRKDVIRWKEERPSHFYLKGKTLITNAKG